MNTRDEIFAGLKEMLETDFEIEGDRITREAFLGADLDFDSIDAIDMIAELQRKLKCRFTPEDFKAVKTVGDVVEIIYARLQENA
ncbi:MAG: acyl carrier protein [Succinimonas sp.]|nr:acyl carrier protein [Succinimonas sp.]